MNFTAIKRLSRGIVLWLVLVAVVALLTLLFTVLGTITCAVLTGMMMGTVRHSRWQTIPVSLVFPGVVFTFVRIMKVELVGSQRILLPALCFGAFWLMYLFTCALVRFERKPGNKPEAAPELRSPESEPKLGEELRLDQLQGRWIYESGSHKGEPAKRVLEINGEHLSLSRTGSDGRAQVLSQGSLRIKSATEKAGDAALEIPRISRQPHPVQLAAPDSTVQVQQQLNG